MSEDANVAPTLVVPSKTDLPVNLSAPSLASLGGPLRYEVGATLGKGGMGEVRACLDPRLSRWIAMKVATAPDPGSLERFVREARVQGQLEHPAIVPVYELGLGDDGAPFFTMKRVRGVALNEVISALCDGEPEAMAKYSRRRLLTAFEAVCLAVEFAHVRGVLHRDLKPANVMLGDFGEVYVLDWGLAKQLAAPGGQELQNVPAPPPGEQPGQTVAGAVMGTPGYMAPEQVLGRAADARSDVWALGAVLFELLTLECLVQGDTVTQLMERTRDGVEARPSVRAPRREVPPELEAICVRATQVDPARRYGSARELHDAVDAFLSGERDGELRGELARAHATAASEAADRAFSGAGDGAQARQAAFREVGQSLALDPSNRVALQVLLRLVAERSPTLPEGAQAELDAADSRQTRAGARAATFGYLSFFIYLPVLLWMGVRSVGLLTLFYGLVTLSALASWLLSVARAPRPGWALAPYAISTLMIASVGFVMSPFVLLPTFAAVNTMATAVGVGPRHRPLVILLGALGVLVPIAAVVLGLSPNPVSFHATGVLLEPQMVALPAGPTLLLLTLSTVGSVVFAALTVARVGDPVREAEERSVIQAWNLRQLLPKEARAATTGESAVASVKVR